MAGRRCGLCRQPGHRRETCKARPAAPALAVDVEDWLFLVERVARRMAKRLPAGVPFDDLISAGHLGLTEAGSRFDLRKGGSFAAFAEPRIRGAILDDLREKDTLSRGGRELQKKMRKAAADVEGETGHAAADQVAAKLGIGLDELHAQQLKTSGAVVMGIDDAPVAAARVPDVAAPDPFEEAARAELRENLTAAVQGLPERMALVLTLRYGPRQLNLRQVGDALGVSESRACQIEQEAIARLRFHGGEGDLTGEVPGEVPPDGDVKATQELPESFPAAPRRRSYRAYRTLGVVAQGVQRRHLRVLAANDDGDDIGPLPPRPRIRGDCIDGPRPCPWISCRHHLYLDVTESGGIRLNHPDLEPDQIPHSCSLDIADDGPHTLEAVGDITQVTRERVRQIEFAATRRATAIAERIGMEDAPERFHSPLGAEITG